MTAVRSASDRDVASGWGAGRWARILDRIDHRQPDVGLRFWGPPLWLEVTMTGPDSDRWPTVDGPVSSWDWQSDEPCVEAMARAAEGADDDRLLAVASRYTIENLILNAIHEIGEWLRFDGRRLFPVHGPGPDLGGRHGQGNGAVTLRLEATNATPDAGRGATPPGPEQHGREHLARLIEVAAPSRFTYLPGTSVSYEASGPVVHRWTADAEPSTWRSAWADSTLAAAASGDEPHVRSGVCRDVHRAFVAHEVDRICRAFHVDGTRTWHLVPPGTGLGADQPDTADGAAPLAFELDHGCGTTPPNLDGAGELTATPTVDGRAGILGATAEVPVPAGEEQCGSGGGRDVCSRMVDVFGETSAAVGAELASSTAAVADAVFQSTARGHARPRTPPCEGSSA